MDDSERQESLINTFVLFSYVNCLFILTQRVPRTDLSNGSVLLPCPLIFGAAMRVMSLVGDYGVMASVTNWAEFSVLI